MSGPAHIPVRDGWGGVAETDAQEAGSATLLSPARGGLVGW